MIHIRRDISKIHIHRDISIRIAVKMISFYGLFTWPLHCNKSNLNIAPNKQAIKNTNYLHAKTHKIGKWYFVTKIVQTYCEKKIALEIEKNF